MSPAAPMLHSKYSVFIGILLFEIACPVPGLSSRGAWPRRTSRLLAFRKGGSFHASWVEKRKSFVHLFKGGRGAGAQFAGGKRSAPTEPAGETDAPAALVAFGKRRRVEKASCGRLFAGVSASAPVGPGRVPLARRTPRRGALVPGGHRSAPTEPAGETSWAGPRPAEGFRKPACPARESVRRPKAACAS